MFDLSDSFLSFYNKTFRAFIMKHKENGSPINQTQSIFIMKFSSSVLVSVFLFFVAASVVDATTRPKLNQERKVKPTRSKAAAACNSLVSFFSRRSREKPPVVCVYAKDHDVEYEPKNIVITFDGTGGHPEWAIQEDNQEHKLYTNGQGLSNVCKLHLYAGGNIGNTYNHFSDEGKDGHDIYKQIACYYSGVATTGSKFRKAIRNVVPGVAIDTMIAEVKEDLKEMFKDGDKLFVFGFSRGAATARLFVSDLDKYQVSSIRVAFLDLYDTVLQSPFKYGTSTSIFRMDINDNKSSELPKIVEKAVHFVAIDEHRYNFQPTLLNKDHKGQGNLGSWMPQ